VLVLGLNSCLGFPLFLYAKVAATRIGLPHFLQVWLAMLQRVHRFSFFVFQPHHPCFHRVLFSNRYARLSQPYCFYFLRCYFTELSIRKVPFRLYCPIPFFRILYCNLCRVLLIFAEEAVCAGLLGILLIFPFPAVPPLAYPLFLKFPCILYRWQMKNGIGDVIFLKGVCFRHGQSTLFLRDLL